MDLLKIARLLYTGIILLCIKYGPTEQCQTVIHWYYITNCVSNMDLLHNARLLYTGIILLTVYQIWTY